MIMITIRIKIETLGKNCGFKPISFFEKNPGHGAVGHLSPSCSEAALRRSFRGAWRWRPNGAWRGVTSKGLSDVWCFWMNLVKKRWTKTVTNISGPLRIESSLAFCCGGVVLNPRVAVGRMPVKKIRTTCLWPHAEDLSTEALKKMTFVWHTKCITTCSACGTAGKTLLCSSARYCSVAKLHRTLCVRITTTEVVTVRKNKCTRCWWERDFLPHK